MDPYLPFPVNLNLGGRSIFFRRVEAGSCFNLNNPYLPGSIDHRLILIFLWYQPRSETLLQCRVVRELCSGRGLGGGLVGRLPGLRGRGPRHLPLHPPAAARPPRRRGPPRRSGRSQPEI